MFKVNRYGNEIVVKTRDPESGNFQFMEKFSVPLPVYFRNLIKDWAPQGYNFSKILSPKDFDACIPDEFNG